MQAAIPLILKEGVAVSTAAIAKAAGVSNGTLFNAFATKQALIDAIFFATKAEMLASLTHAHGAPFNRETVQRNWSDYLAWARRHPQERRIMHLLLDAGLVSLATRQEIDALGAPYGAWVAEALDQGTIRGPNVDYIVRLIFFHLDLVIDMSLDEGAAAMAFDMFCNCIGLTQ